MEEFLSIKKILSRKFIEQHAMRSNIVYGSAIYHRQAVKIIEQSNIRIEAWVGGLEGKVVEGGGSKRRVEFIASKNGLQWHCTGNPKHHQIFCKHCVALALELIKKPKGKVKKIWHVYILRCGDGSLYTGISNDVGERVKKHNAGKGAAYTRSHLPVELVWKEKVKSESAAKKREAQIKRLARKDKQILIRSGQL